MRDEDTGGLRRCTMAASTPCPLPDRAPGSWRRIRLPEREGGGGTRTRWPLPPRHVLQRAMTSSAPCLSLLPCGPPPQSRRRGHLTFPRGSRRIGLLVNEGEDSQDAAPTSDPTIHETPATTKSSQGRTKNFSSAEDILLVSAWLNVDMDPVQGVDQSQGTYWRRIYKYFHANKTFESTRTEVSLMNRWCGIQHDVNVFCRCVARIEAKNQSGSIVDDKIAHACALFKAEDKKERKFNFMHCWNILKDKPKWMDKRKEIGTAKKTSNKKRKTMAISAPASVVPADAPAALATAGDVSEPAGRPDEKKEKQKLRQQKLRQCLTMEAVDYLMAKKKEADLEKDLKKEERCNKAFALQEERIKLEREKFEFQRELEEDRIIDLDLSTMTYKQQQYYEDRKNKILARRLNI